MGTAKLVQLHRPGSNLEPVRRAVHMARRHRSRRIAMRGVHAGEEPDDSERWAVRRVVQVRRPAVRRGRQLEALVQWEGEGWVDSWEPVTRLSADLRDEARRMEKEAYAVDQDGRPEHGRSGQTGSARAARREANRQRQERERADQQWTARLRDREPSGRVKRKLTEDA